MEKKELKSNSDLTGQIPADQPSSVWFCKHHRRMPLQKLAKGTGPPEGTGSRGTHVPQHSLRSQGRLQALMMRMDGEVNRPQNCSSLAGPVSLLDLLCPCQGP